VTALSINLGAVLALVRRDAKIFISYRFRFATQLVSTFFGLVLFYYLSRIVGHNVFHTSNEYFAFAVIGLTVMEVLGATLAALPLSLRQELVAGTFERLVLSPFGAIGAVASMMVFPFLLSAVSALITLTLATLVFGMNLAWSTAAYAIPVALLGAAAFAPFSLLIAASVLSVKQAGAGAGFFVTGISLIGGFFFPVSLLPSWIRWASDVQPFTPALQLLRHLLVGTPATSSAWLTVAKLAGFAVVLVPASLVVLHRAIRFAQRRGTIIEY